MNNMKTKSHTPAAKKGCYASGGLCWKFPCCNHEIAVKAREGKQHREILKDSPDDGAKTVWHSGKRMALCEAAPELLEAAKASLDVLEQIIEVADIKGHEGLTIKILRDAIAKAEGETNE